MKNIFKVKIHFFFYVILIIAILTGNFKIFILLTIITIFHELGHIITSILFDWKIEKIIIYPVSLLTIFNTKINCNKYEELLVTIMGPIFQLLLCLVIKDDVIYKYNLLILIFNLIPIIPLDGYKILKIILYQFIPFLLVEKIGIIISVVCLGSLLIISNYNLIVIFIFIVFLFKTIKEYLNIKYIFSKFLFERNFYDLKYKKDKVIKLKKDMFKYRNNIIIKNNIILTEREFLMNL